MSNASPKGHIRPMPLKKPDPMTGITGNLYFSLSYKYLSTFSTRDLQCCWETGQSINIHFHSLNVLQPQGFSSLHALPSCRGGTPTRSREAWLRLPPPLCPHHTQLCPKCCLLPLTPPPSNHILFLKPV